MVKNKKYLQRENWGVMAEKNENFSPWRLKQWHFLSLNDEKFFFTWAFVNFRYLSSVFGYLYDKENKKILLDYSWRMLGSGGVTFFPQQRGELLGQIWKRGESSAWWHTSGDEAFFQVYLPKKIHLAWRGAFTPAPVNLLADYDERHRAFTSKHVGLEVSGSFHLPGRDVQTFQGLPSSSDWTYGYFPREVKWQWASMTQKLENKMFGFNFSRFIYESQKGETWESFLSWGEEVFLLPFVTMDFSKKPFVIVAKSNDPEEKTFVELTFTPHYLRQENVQLVIVKTAFEQSLGCFSGRVVLKGREIPLNNLFGLMEEHESLW